MKLGCSTILYGKHGVDDALAGIQKAGYDGIELCAIPSMGFHIDPEAGEASWREVKQKVEDRGLIVESIGGSGNDPNDRGPGSRFKNLMRAASIVGAKAVTTGTGGASGSAEDMKVAVDNFNTLTEYAKEVGTMVSIKPHVGAVVFDTPSSLEFMKQVDSDWIGLNVDPSHLWRAPEWEAGESAIPKLAQYLCTGRIRDTLTHEQGIGPIPTQIPGGGAIDLKAVMDAYKQVPGLEIVTVEIVGTADWSLEDIQDVVEKTFAGLKPLC